MRKYKPVTLEGAILLATCEMMSDGDDPARCILARDDFDRLVYEVMGIRSLTNVTKLEMFVPSGSIQVEVGDPGNRTFHLIPHKRPVFDPEDMLHL